MGIDEMSTEELKQRIMDLSSYKDEAEMRFEKIQFIVSELIAEYGEDSPLNPKAAVADWMGTEKTAKGHKAVKILYEIGKITTALSMAEDYTDTRTMFCNIRKGAK